MLLWAVSKVINAHEEFKYGWDENGDLIRWDFLSPSYTVFHREEKGFTKLIREYCEDLPKFYERYMADGETYKDIRGFAGNQAPKFYDASCLSWVKYKHFDLPVFDEGKFLAPVVTWGKCEPEGGKVLLPLTMNIHHAVADGFHLCRFFNEVQAVIDRRR